MSISDEVLMAYADGELDSQTRAEVEKAMAADPQLGRRVAEHQALRKALRGTYDKVLEETIPERLLAATRGRQAPSNVIPLRKRQKPPRAVPYWGAIAASFVVGALVWHFAGQLYSSDPVIERGGQLLASGSLDRALSTQLVKDQQAQAAVRIGVSFRSKDGSYCRTFQLAQADNLAGLACREQGQWKLEVLARGEAAPSGHPQFRAAASSLPPAVAQAVDATIDGEPMNAEAEEHASARKWESR